MARLYLGSIDKMDTAYINGRQVGASSWVENPRTYFANGVLKPGRNVIALRIFKAKPGGGFLGKADEIHLTLPAEWHERRLRVHLLAETAPEVREEASRFRFPTGRTQRSDPLLSKNLVEVVAAYQVIQLSQH